MADERSQNFSSEVKRIEQLREDIAELHRLAEGATREKVKQMISMDIKRLETEISNLQQIVDSTSRAASVSKVVSIRPTVTSNLKIVNYAWDQSDKFVKLYVTLTDVHTIPAENVKTEFTANSVDLQVIGLDNKNHQLKITSLLKTIRPEESHSKVKSDSVVVFLRKTSPDTWAYVTALEQKAEDAKKPKFEENEDPNESLMKMMKRMYNEGDDEMKKAIAKAWTETRNKTPSADDFPKLP